MTGDAFIGIVIAISMTFAKNRLVLSSDDRWESSDFWSSVGCDMVLKMWRFALWKLGSLKKQCRACMQTVLCMEILHHSHQTDKWCKDVSQRICVFSWHHRNADFFIHAKSWRISMNIWMLYHGSLDESVALKAGFCKTRFFASLKRCFYKSMSLHKVPFAIISSHANCILLPLWTRIYHWQWSRYNLLINHKALCTCTIAFSHCIKTHL